MIDRTEPVCNTKKIEVKIEFTMSKTNQLIEVFVPCF